MGENVIDSATDAARRVAYAAGVALRAREIETPATDYELALQEGAIVKDPIVLRADSGERVEIDAQMSCNSSKNIVATAINGMEGTIKEWVSNGDVMISCEVTLVGENGEYPERQVRELCALLQRSESLQVESAVLNDIWGVTRIVVTGWQMTPTRTTNIQQIAFRAQSDAAYIIMEDMYA